MKIPVKFFGILTRILSTIVACFASAAPAQDLPALASANNSFGFDLLGQIAAGQPGKNIFISPFSAACALQMVANGADGQTQTEMENVLKTAGWSPKELDESYRNLNGSLTAPREAMLEIANSIWFQDGIRLKPAFIADNKGYFKAGLADVDFQSPKSADIINNWAEKNTHGKIGGVVSFPFPPLTKLVLADAIYFKGKWEKPFMKGETEPREFHLPDGGTKQTPMMQRDDKFKYQETTDYQAVQLPYRGNLLMEVFLPKTNSNPQKLVETFRGKDAWQKTVETGFSQREGFLALPKFKMNYDVDLNEPLKALGMKQAFGVDANFSGISGTPLFISQVKQKSYVAVDEEGTEAAAVTTVEMHVLSMPVRPRNRFEMIVDRPFLFVIIDDETQTVLFMGIVNEPKNKD